MEFDAGIDRFLGEFLWVSLLGGLVVFAYLAILAREHLKATLLVRLYRECIRRRDRQEELRRTWGYAPRLAHYQGLEKTLLRHLEERGIAPGPR